MITALAILGYLAAGVAFMRYADYKAKRKLEPLAEVAAVVLWFPVLCYVLVEWYWAKATTR